MNAHNIVAQAISTYNNSVSETNGTKQYGKEAANFNHYLSNNLNSSYFQDNHDRIQHVIKSKKLAESNRSSTLDRNTEKRVPYDNVISKDSNETKQLDLDAKLQELSKQMKESIKETLNLDDKELEQIMSQLGLSMQDLLIPENLKLLCLTASGESDVLELLTNEELSKQLSELLDTLQEMNLNELGIGAEELQRLLSDYGYSDGSVLEENVDINTTPMEEVILTSQPEELVSTEESIPFQNNTVKVVIEKEDGQSSYLQETLPTEGGEQNISQEDNFSQDSKLGMNQLDEEKKITKQAASNEPIEEQFINHLNQTAVSHVEVVNGQLATVTQIRDIVNQIVNEIRVHILPDTTNMELQLNPDNLGKVNLSILSKDGVVTAEFRVESAIAKEAIESQIHMLRENLNNQGVKVESIEVTVSNFSFTESNHTNESNQEQKRSQKQLKLDGFDENVQESDGIDELMHDYGNTVDYTA